MRSRELLVSFLVAALPAVAGLSGRDLMASTASLGQGVLICHHAGPNHMKTLRVGESAVPNHIQSHGDYIGACGTQGGDGGDETDS